MGIGTGTLIIPHRGGEAGKWGSAKSATISGGVITVQPGFWYKLPPESGNTDDLVTVNGLSEGDSIYLSTADAAYTIIIKHGTGNFDLVGDIDIILNSTKDMSQFMFDGTNLIEASSRP